MYGAIIGDIVGSIYEFNNHRSKKFPLFQKDCFFTDDTVMSAAVAKALLNCQNTSDLKAFKEELIRCMHDIGVKYPDCGYGGRFYSWIMDRQTEPYNSFGNGSAMRVSPVGWYASTLEEAEALAKATAEITHNHPEGIKGAVSVSGAVYLAKNGANMDEIKEYVSKYYTISFTIDEIRPIYRFNETCQETVPQAFAAFFESESFEDAIRTAISVGGDSDTLAAITGSVAEAYYGISNDMLSKAKTYLDDEMTDIVKSFEKYIVYKQLRKPNSKPSERIIIDSYVSGFAPEPDPFLHEDFRIRIIAVNRAYEYLYTHGILQKVAFEFVEREDRVHFALDTADLEPYRKELERADIPNIDIAVREIFDENYTPCLYSGAIELTWTMDTYRDFDGTVERSWEIEPCRHMSTERVLDVQQILESNGAREAAKYIFSLR